MIHSISIFETIRRFENPVKCAHAAFDMTQWKLLKNFVDDLSQDPWVTRSWKVQEKKCANMFFYLIAIDPAIHTAQPRKTTDFDLSVPKAASKNHVVLLFMRQSVAIQT